MLLLICLLGDHGEENEKCRCSSRIVGDHQVTLHRKQGGDIVEDARWTSSAGGRTTVARMNVTASAPQLAALEVVPACLHAVPHVGTFSTAIYTAHDRMEIRGVQVIVQYNTILHAMFAR